MKNLFFSVYNKWTKKLISFFIFTLIFSNVNAQTNVDLAYWNFNSLGNPWNNYQADNGIYSGSSSTLVTTANGFAAANLITTTGTIINRQFSASTGNGMRITSNGSNNNNWIEINSSTLGYNNLTFSFAGRSNGANAFTEQLAYWDGSSWINIGTSFKPGVYAANIIALPTELDNQSAILLRIFFSSGSATGTNDFDNITIIGDVASLPIVMVNFEGNEIYNNTSKLSWIIDNSSIIEFEILKSTNDTILESIGNIKIKENINNYEYIDNTFIKTSNYQLKLIDSNGNYTYSNIINIKTSIENIQSISIYPNPIISNIIKFQSSYEKNDVTVELFDNIGKSIISYKINIIIGENDLILNNKLESGIYFIKFISNDNIINKKIIVY